MITNLIYVFLDSKFSDSKDLETSLYVYDQQPDFYQKTFNYNKRIFTNSYFLTQNNIQAILEDEQFKAIDDVINRKWAHYKKKPFWYNTFIRVILLAIFIKQNQLTNTIHVEADNIIFADDLTTLVNTINDGEFAYCSEGTFSSAPSFLFFKDAIAAEKLVKLHIQLLERGDPALQPYVGFYVHNITDMALLDLIKRGNIPNYKMLPCLPFGINSANFSEIGYVFDPTSYGQYLGGTNNGHVPGFIDHNHFVGLELSNKTIEVIFDKRPYVIYNGNRIPVFNLHVHNKKAIEGFLYA
jgi:hypothetical protein